MYYRHIETNAKFKAAHDAGLKSDARARLDKMEHKRRADCVMNRKAAKKLAARQDDWATMVEQTSFKAPDGAYHKPGSMKV